MNLFNVRRLFGLLLYSRCYKLRLWLCVACAAFAYNGSGIAEGRDLEAESLNLAQMPNRIKNIN